MRSEGTPHVKLTSRELEILTWTSSGKSSMEIATQLNLAHETVRTRIKVICRKLGARNKTHAAILAFQLKLLDIKIHPNG